MRTWKIGKGNLGLTEGNIALLEADAIVNAANSSLVLGGGVAGAIRKFGGESIQKECDRLGPIRVGEAVATGAGNLKAKYVIHAVGPRAGEGQEEEKLRRAVRSSLDIAREKNLDSIVFPAISTGIFGFPLDRCAAIMIPEALAHLRSERRPQNILFCLYTHEDYEVFEKTALELLSSDLLESPEKVGQPKKKKA